MKNAPRGPLTVIGAGGHAVVVISTARLVGFDVVALYDDDPAMWGREVLGVRVSGPPSAPLAHSGGALFVAIGQVEARRRLVESMGHKAVWATLVHPHAYVDAAAVVDEGVLVCVGAVVQPEAHVGAHAIVNTAASVDHHAHVGAFSHVGPGARLNGHARLGTGTLLGSGAVVLPGGCVGEAAVIGAGAVVLGDIGPGIHAAGIPARTLAPDRALSLASSGVSVSSLPSIVQISSSSQQLPEAPLAPGSTSRVYLSPPHLTGEERPFVDRALSATAPTIDQIEAFEAEMAACSGARYAVAVSSGTAALHLALRVVGVCEGDEVAVSSFTFCASVNPIRYQGALPVLLDSDTQSWNMDPNLLADWLARRAEAGRLPRAVMLVHIYGGSADVEAIAGLCERYGVALVEDAAEAVGTMCGGRMVGTFGRVGVYSFNSNKIITATGGGMLVTDDRELARHARKLAIQARDAAPHYQHSEIGYNYRLSNVLAGIGRGQLQVLDDRIARRRATFETYREALGDLPGVAFMPEAPGARHTRWLTCLTLDAARFGADAAAVRAALNAVNIEARPLWKPMHQQPIFADCEAHVTGVSDRLFADGLCLPSGSNLTDDDLARVVEAIRACARPV